MGAGMQNVEQRAATSGQMEAEMQQHSKQPVEEAEKKAQSAGVTGLMLYKKITQQQFRCALSGVELSTENSTLDHMIPMSRGGLHSIENVEWIHAVLNRMKGEMTKEEFVFWCTKVAEFAEKNVADAPRTDQKDT